MMPPPIPVVMPTTHTEQVEAFAHTDEGARRSEHRNTHIVQDIDQHGVRVARERVQKPVDYLLELVEGALWVCAGYAAFDCGDDLWSEFGGGDDVVDGSDLLGSLDVVDGFEFGCDFAEFGVADLGCGGGEFDA